MMAVKRKVPLYNAVIEDSLKEPFEVLKRNDITKVYEFLDMDKIVNKKVAKVLMICFYPEKMKILDFI